MYKFNLEEGELILKKGHATLFSDDINLKRLLLDANTLAGVLYLTTARIVFIGYLLSATSKHIEEIPLVHIHRITSENSLFVVPNAIRITTIRDKEFLLVVYQRDEWLSAIEKQADRV